MTAEKELPKALSVFEELCVSVPKSLQKQWEDEETTMLKQGIDGKKVYALRIEKGALYVIVSSAR